MPGESFIGERLQLAREFRGLTQKRLGDEVAASVALVSLCETGKKKDPAADLVEAFASVLGFETAFFYRPVEDAFREEECSFRHRRSTPERLKTRIRAQATLIGMVVQRLRSVFKFPPFNVPSISIASPKEIENAAERSRQHWHLSPDGPIVQICRVLEHAGVVIVSHLVESAKVDAFSRYGPTTIIFLNKAIPSTSRWTFDIAHELAHLAIHRDAYTGSVETESEADRFASAFLMPRAAFSREFSSKPFSWPHVFDLKKRWRVSAAAIVRRAYDLGLLGAVGYRQAFKYMSAKGWRSNGEPAEPTFQNPELLSAALTALGPRVDFTLDQLCHSLGFGRDTFHDVTGVSIPGPGGPSTEVIPFPAAG